jgi:ubiquinol-cytochrome c reductase cytochrome c1 subunit
MWRSVCALVLAVPFTISVAAAASGEVELEHAGNDVANVASLQRGARNFVNYCMGCHSAKYVRYNRLGKDLGISDEQLMKNIMFTGERPFDTMQSGMSPDDAKTWFGVAPPDLSLIERSRGADYIYTFLKSFYVDPSRPSGTNNRVLPGTAMPHVLWELQGWQTPAYEGESKEGKVENVKFSEFKLTSPGTMSPEEYDGFVRDTVNFLDYIGEPMQNERRSLGISVLGFLLIFFLFAYFLKREFWKDVH